MGDFQIVDHTADVGLLVRGRDLKDCFETAARGMVSILCDIRSITAEARREIRVEAENVEELLLNWLREVLYRVEREWIVFSRFFIEEESFVRKASGGYRLDARLEGGRLNPERHGICTEIKAITRHGLAVQKKDHGWELTVLFDV